MNGGSGITREIERAKRGPAAAAFFDFDGTVIAGFSVAAFAQRRVMSGKMSPREILGQLEALRRYVMKQADFEETLAASARTTRGIADAAMWDTAREVYEKHLSANVYPESRALIDAHRARGHTVVLVSSATQYQVRYIAEELGIEHVLCTRLDVRDGMLTGDIVPPACYGKAKRDAALAFADANGIDPGRSFFYTDGAEDIPLLESVGFPRPLNPDDELGKTAGQRGWPVRSFSSRGLPGLADLVRTGLVYGGLTGSFLAGLPAFLLNRSKRDLVNVATGIWGDFGSAVAGLDIETEGEEHLWSHRPAVFVFNHQSQTDALIVARLLRRDFTGIAKKEMKSNLLVGTILDAVGTVFVDRENSRQAIEALKPAADSLRNGMSIAIAPEGSRSLGRKLGPFKTGAFHIAMQAGVPIVPIVIRNSADSQPRGSAIIRPARISVKVLRPVATDKWTLETVHEHAATVHDMFLEVLGQSRKPGVKLRRVK